MGLGKEKGVSRMIEEDPVNIYPNRLKSGSVF